MAEIKFEKAMNRLEQIVEELEKGELDIDKSLEMFEEGIKCLECSCDSNYAIHNDGNTRIDCDKQSNNTYDKELTLPREVDYCSIH